MKVELSRESAETLLKYLRAIYPSWSHCQRDDVDAAIDELVEAVARLDKPPDHE